MNKRQIISSLINNANNLDNSGFYKEANILTKLAYDILPEDIIMPGEQRTNINNTTDEGNVEISLNDIQNQFITMVKTIQSLPDTHDDGEYFGRLKSELLSKMYSAGSKLGSLFTEAGLDTNTLDDYMDRNM